MCVGTCPGRGHGRGLRSGGDCRKFVVDVDLWALQKVTEKVQFPGLELKRLPEAGR